jgi:hypothetical protein
MLAKEALEKAAELVGGDRAEAYGDIYQNHKNISMLWNGYLYNIDELKPEDVANMMELMKIARRKTGVFNADDYVDGAGYSAVALECREKENNRKDFK